MLYEEIRPSCPPRRKVTLRPPRHDELIVVATWFVDRYVLRYTVEVGDRDDLNIRAAYPFTAPAERPRMKCFWATKKSSTLGSSISTAAAKMSS